MLCENNISVEQYTRKDQMYMFKSGMKRFNIDNGHGDGERKFESSTAGQVRFLRQNHQGNSNKNSKKNGNGKRRSPQKTLQSFLSLTQQAN